MQFMDVRKRREVWQSTVPEMCSFQLCGYAESLRDLAKSFEKGESPDPVDRRSFFEEEKLRENCDVIAGHLRELAQMMEQTADEVTGMAPMEEKIYQRLSRFLSGEGIVLEGACMLPTNEQGRKIGLNIRAQDVAGVSGEVVEKVLSRVLGRNYVRSFSSPEWVGREGRLFLFVEQPQFMAFTGFARVVKGREEISGDNYSILQSECGKLTLLLSDGTGSGEQAYEDSGWVLDLVEKLLETGYGMETAMRMVNAAILAKGGDKGHPTLDMCRMDLQKGSCYFCKAGGAVSFCKRGAEVEEIEGGKLPLGIFQDLEPHRHFQRLEEGDGIFLMTDGVLEAFRDRGYEDGVRSALAEMKEGSPREMAEKLMQMAIFASGGDVRDDMTILAATLWRN